MSRRLHMLPLPFSLLVSVTIAVFLAIVGAAQAQGLVAVYGFNEGSGTAVADVSGNSNHGTVSGATWTTAGRFGSALVFNGANAVVTIPNSASLRLTTGMTLEAWVYPTSAPTGWRAVVDKKRGRLLPDGVDGSGQSARGWGHVYGGEPEYFCAIGIGGKHVGALGGDIRMGRRYGCT